MELRDPGVRWGRLLALLLGALPVLAFPETDISWLGFVGLVPLLLLIREAPSAREAGVRGWLAGTGFFVAMHHWLLPNVGVFTIAVGPALGVLWLPWGRTVWRWTRDVHSPRRLFAALLVVPSVWVVIEFARSWDRLAGPWGLLGATQWQNLRFLSLAALGGVWLVSLALMAVNTAVALVVARGVPTRARLGAAAVAVGIVVGGFTFGLVRPDPTEYGTATVAGVQTGRVQDGPRRFDAHLELTRRLVGTRPDLVVWGESSVGFDLETSPRQLAAVSDLAADLGADVIVNVDARKGGEGGIYKSSVLVGPDGARGRYDKMRLVPFGEYVPLRPLFGWTASVTEAADEDRRRGSGLAVLETSAADGRRLRLGPLVCFESAFPDMSRELARMGADLIVLQTATTTFQGSWGQSQHAALSAVRAVESGRPVIHAAMSGVSAIFDATGHRLTWLDDDERGVYTASVPLVSGRTPYVRFRDWVPLLSMAVAALALGFTLRQRRS